MAISSRQPRGQVDGRFGVVKDQQPLSPPPQLGQRRLAGGIGQPGSRLYAAQVLPQFRELAANQPGLVRTDPPHHVIAVREAVRVLHGQLRLADPAYSLQRLHGRPVPGQQPGPDSGQELLPPDEPRITWRYVPPQPPHRPGSPQSTGPSGGGRVLVDDGQVPTGGEGVPLGLNILADTCLWTVLPAGHRTPPVLLARTAVVDHRLVPARDVSIPARVHLLSYPSRSGQHRPHFRRQSWISLQHLTDRQPHGPQRVTVMRL